MAQTNQKPGFLRDPIWQFIATVVAIVAIIAGYDIFFRQRSIKSLQIVELTNSSLFDVRSDQEGSITVQYKGRPVKNAVLLEYRLENNGDQPITETDYDRAIVINLLSGYEFGSIINVTTIPESIIGNRSEDSIYAGGGNFELQFNPILLNPGDSVTTKVVVISNTKIGPAEFTVDGRVVGVKDIPIISLKEQEIRQANQKQNIDSAIKLLTIILWSFLVVQGVYSYWRYRQRQSKSKVSP